MNNVVEFRKKITTDGYFGGCPTCGESDGFLNRESEHWFVCHAHKTKWSAGSNLFSGWREESEAQRLQNLYRLSEYRTVEPVMPLRSDDRYA